MKAGWFTISAPHPTAQNILVKDRTMKKLAVLYFQAVSIAQVIVNFIAELQLVALLSVDFSDEYVFMNAFVAITVVPVKHESLPPSKYPRSTRRAS